MVCECRGEADVCISTQHGPVVVATSDSDFLFHGVNIVFRQDPQQRSKYHSYDVQDMLEVLGMTEDAWIVAGTVSKKRLQYKYSGLHN